MTEAIQGLFQRGKGTERCYRDFLTFDGWFSSKRSYEDVMDVGSDTIGRARTNKMFFPRITSRI